ncbi:DUF1818 family protein [Okeania sp. SIO2G5]|uniref:DUF1818 family protein n=1 Tax=Okeania sp. SIO2G5 TaxID=2607796 RepID=UPI0013C19884|nr:DUF1818 family protein [Okeania sp. SIO2G5]NEP76431.1 DUF1818 family protein [Okeania sp. SIO2G5]
MVKRIQQGEGWRLGVNSDAPLYPGLVGTESWSLELTEIELQDFCRLTLQLADTMNAIASELMDEERVSCVAESEVIWLEAEGFPEAYELRLMLLTGRRGEGEWSTSAVPELLNAIRLIDAF